MEREVRRHEPLTPGPPDDGGAEFDEFAHPWWQDAVIVVVFVLVLGVAAVALWLSVQDGGSGCGPVHQALGHC
jgi:hypothetical protein